MLLIWDMSWVVTILKVHVAGRVDGAEMDWLLRWEKDLKSYERGSFTSSLLYLRLHPFTNSSLETCSLIVLLELKGNVWDFFICTSQLRVWLMNCWDVIAGLKKGEKSSSIASFFPTFSLGKWCGRQKLEWKTKNHSFFMSFPTYSFSDFLSIIRKLLSSQVYETPLNVENGCCCCQNCIWGMCVHLTPTVNSTFSSFFVFFSVCLIHT